MTGKWHKVTLREMARRKKRRLIKRDGEVCRYCGTTDNLTVDHVLPISLGGKSGISNLAIACASCNQAKGSRTHEEFLDLLANPPPPSPPKPKPIPRIPKKPRQEFSVVKVRKKKPAPIVAEDLDLKNWWPTKE